MYIDTSSQAYTILKIFSQAINPALIIALITGLAVLWRHDKARFRGILIASIVSIVLVYLIKGVEGRNDIWENWGMNFSSHSALAIACCTALAFVWQRRWWVFASLFIAYALFMIFMQFHTAADILSTAAVIVPVCWICQFVACRRCKSTFNRHKEVTEIS